MIKSFHSIEERETNTHIKLVNLGDGTVGVNVVYENGYNPGNNKIMFITKDGIQVLKGFDGEDFGIKNEDGLSRVRVINNGGDILMTHAEWIKKYPCSDIYHTYLVKVQDCFVCDRCGKDLDYSLGGGVTCLKN